MQVILIIGAVQALFFAVLLLNKKGKRMPDKILVFWLIIFALHLSFVYFIFQKGYSTYIEYGAYVSGVVILYYSLMYIYAKSIITNDNAFNIKWLFHIIPTGITYISMIPYILLSFEEKIALFDHNLSENLFVNLLAITIILFITSYVVVIFRLLKKHEINIKKTFSYDENINLAWLKKLSIILVVIWVILSLSIFFMYYKEYTSDSGTDSIEFYTQLEMYGHCLFVAFVYLLGYFGYKQGNIFTFQKTNSGFDKMYAVDNEANIVQNNIKSNKDVENEEKEFVDLFNKYMVMQKPYLNSELSLYQLANELGVSTHYLSNILNNYIHKNFYEFINYYRVSEVKKRIISNKNPNFTLLAIALDCGFNSKAQNISILLMF
jgi:AraC-like DNA-binding protein/NADH:ubiquinone oxidoreductase subunit 6 (subunit J)